MTQVIRIVDSSVINKNHYGFVFTIGSNIKKYCKDNNIKYYKNSNKNNYIDNNTNNTNNKNKNDGFDYRFAINKNSSTNVNDILKMYSNFDKYKLLENLEDNNVSNVTKIYLINNLFNILDF
jgi:hypothetical protein